jgi:hypothetical protein
MSAKVRFCTIDFSALHVTFLSLEVFKHMLSELLCDWYAKLSHFSFEILKTFVGSGPCHPSSQTHPIFIHIIVVHIQIYNELEETKYKLKTHKYLLIQAGS